MTELCGKPTPSGKTCNMRKGHSANFHRHRIYVKPITWKILTKSHKIIEEGSGREELGYATTKALAQFDNLIIEIAKP